MANDLQTSAEDYEFLVLPAPKKGERAANCKTDGDRMANTLTELFNDMAEDGWLFQRAERLPNDQGSSLSGTGEAEVTLLIFRRPLPPQSAQAQHAGDPLVLTNPLNV